jgi:hypothetical protein
MLGDSLPTKNTYQHDQNQRYNTYLISWRDVEELASGSAVTAPPNHDLVLTKALDHEVRGFWGVACVPGPPRLMLPRLQALPSLLFPDMDSSPLPLVGLFGASPFQGRLWTLKLVLELAGVPGEVRLARVAPEVRCESAFVEVGEGGAWA